MNNYMKPNVADPSQGMQYYGPSPMANSQSIIYNGYTTSGSPGAHPMSQNMYADDMSAYGMDDGGDNGDPKRRRIARACDMCRKKKIKCDGKMPACTHCQNYKTECIFTQVEKKRNPPKGLSGVVSNEDADATDLGTLEKRLAEKTAASRREDTPANRESASAQSKDGSSTANTPQQTATSPDSANESPEPEKEGRKEAEVEALSDMMCSLVTNNCSSSGFSIFSPKGIQWVNEKTGDNSFQEMISTASVDDNKWIHWKPDVFRDIFTRRVYKPLPPKDEALSLLKDYFENFNCMFPLFHEPTFMHLVDKHYSRDPYEGSGWWASLNVVLAIAHRLRVMSNLVPQDEDQKAWGYLKNAMAVQIELTIRNTDLLSVQALLGMALFLQGTPNPQPSFFLIAAAIRLSHSIGLHKRGSGFNLNPSEIEQRKRVFWIAYMLDRDLCLRSGRPPIQDDDDMNVDLPSESPPDNIGNIPLADGKGKVNLFRLMCQFAVIASKVYKQLYSVKASKQSDGELLNTIGELDRELEDWKDTIPIDFRPEHEIKASHTPLILHVVVLHFAYYNCLTTIHRMSVHHGYWTSRLSNYAIQGLNARPLNPRVFSSAALCVSAARASIQLIKYVPQGDYDCVWLVLYYPVSALVTLFANILQNPTDSRARADLKLMNQVVSFLSALCADDENASVRRMLSVCSEFERIAKIVLDKTEKESHSRRKRKNIEPTKDEKDKPIQATTPTATTSASTPKQYTPATPQPSQPGNIPNVFTPPDYSKFTAEDGFMSLNGNLPNSTPGPNGTSTVQSTWLSPQAASALLPISGNMSAASPTPSASSAISSGFPGDMNMGNMFSGPFVPQDLWQMPMTLDWDWADLTGGYTGFDDPNVASGLAANGVLNDIPALPSRFDGQNNGGS
ncbi:hypothetical protein E2P81_ATG02829 [Venturia nashicola]|nr:hypothetical protein E2P81_ATG02829 [Venturia nashicola]